MRFDRRGALAAPAAACLAALIAASAPLSASAAAPDPWGRGAEWFSVRGGYAKSTVEGSADGNLGAGFGYTRFRNTKWAYGAQAEINLLGRYGHAHELEIPWTLEATRHYHWNTALRPYLGFGAGAYYHKISGTGQDRSKILPGIYGLSGANLPVSDHSLLGLELRINAVRASGGKDPVFGGPTPDASVKGFKKFWLIDPSRRLYHWGLKINYAWVF